MSASALELPPLYAIADRETLDRHGVSLRAFAEDLREGGARLVQYRDKVSAPREILRAAREIARVFEGAGATLILNDYQELAVELGWGCHVGQGDMAPAKVRELVSGVVGVSTHNEKQILPLRQAQGRDDNFRSVDYIAIGPVFGTATKRNAEPVVGLEGVRAARALTQKPLVAIGGITLETANAVRDAGADCIAVIGALLPREGMSTRRRVEAFLELLGN